MNNTMWKQSLIFVLVVLAVVLSVHYLAQVSDLLWAFYQWGHGLLAPLFSSRGVGHIILGVLSLGVVPLVVSAVPTTGYWILTKKQFPYFWSLVWAVLLVLATLLMVHT
ncbi:MAG: hypothetical protein K0R48_580 [Gammaproteobacteria bacterium]|nr:hypothetical protein [Gammaproteobacteria bacterium]